MRTGSLYLLLMLTLTGSTTTTTNTTTTTTTTTPIRWSGIKKFEVPPTPLPSCPAGEGEGRGGLGWEGEACLLTSPRIMDWRSAHRYCRGQGGFLIGRSEMTHPNVTEMTLGNLTWTALGPHEGRLQWLTQRPVLGQFLPWAGKEGGGRKKKCAALHLPSFLFHSFPCSSPLPFHCLLVNSPEKEESHPGDDFELRVEVELSDGESEVREVEEEEGWVRVREEDFSLLSLTCTAHHHLTSPAAQPQVFWSKDGVYLPVHAPTLIPAAVHDATKSLVTANTSLPLLQGTYWCETWQPASPTPLASNKLLLTLQGREVQLLHLHSRRQSPPLTTHSLEAKVRTVFASLPGFDGIYDFPIDVMSIQEDEAEFEGLVSARVQVHFPAASAAFDELLHLLVDGQGVEKLLEKAGFLASSVAALPTRCRNSSSPLPGGNTLSWPFTRVGPVQPRHHRCESAAGELLTGRCHWNYTHGATVHLDIGRCQRFDFCPRGYTGLADSFCVSLTPRTTWDEGVEAAHGSNISMSVLDAAWLHEAGQTGTPSMYEEARRWLGGQDNSTVLWLPARRFAPFGPLSFVGPVASKFPIGRHDGSPSFNVSWRAGQPAAAHDCLALDTEASHLLTLPCSNALPFLTVLDVRGLLAIPTLDWRAAAPNLLTKNPLCPGWMASEYPGSENACFSVFRNESALSWSEAAKLCVKFNAHLPDPSHGFLDWPLRQLLYNHDIPSVWIRIPSPRRRREENQWRSTYLNWLADVDASLPHAALTPWGWERETHGSVKTHVMCQRRVQSLEVTLDVFKDAGTVLVEMRPHNASMEGGIHCFVNGREAPMSDQGGVLKVDSITQGYYECRVWAGLPLRLITSNTLLLTHPNTHTFSVTVSSQTQYAPALHDATFRHVTGSLKERCFDTFQQEVQQDFATAHGAQANVDNVFFTHDTFSDTLLVNFHVNIDISVAIDHMSENEAAEIIAAKFGQLSSAHCRLVSIRSCLGCHNEVEDGRGSNETTLTWPATRGSAAVLPDELCVTEEGQPVIRECLGNFIFGYYWDNRSGECTDRPLNVTQQLWEINQGSSPSDPTSLATLTAHGEDLIPADVLFVALKIRSISRQASMTPQDMKLMVETLNNVMEAEEDVLGEMQRILNTSSILIDAFEKSTFRVQLPRVDQPVSGDRRLISAARVDLTPDSPVTGYKTWREDKYGEDDQEEEEVLVRKTGEVDWQHSEVTLILPEELTRRVLAEAAVKEGRSGHASGRVQLTFAVYRNSKLFQDNTTFPNYTVDGHIIQSSFAGHSVADLHQPVEIYFKTGHKGRDSKCVFWDFQENNGRGGWSTVGCWSGEQRGEHQLCLCNHLTSFAHLVTFDGQVAAGVHAMLLDTISIIGCSLSIFSLLLVLTTFFLFPKWRRRLDNKILASLAAAILSSLVVFLAGIQQTMFPLMCRGVAVALHYFILASFGWMLVEAVRQYLKFVKVYNYIPRFMWKASVCAWGSPFLPIVAVLIYDSTLYDSDQGPEDKICWMSSTAFKFAFLPPLTITMATNLVLYVLTVYSVTCGRVRINSNLTERQVLRTQLSMAISVFFLLGFSWVFGLLAFWYPSLVFSYLFCISNTLHGFFLFIFHVYKAKEAYRLWRDFLSVIVRGSTASEQASQSMATPGSSNHPSRAGDSAARQRLVIHNLHGEVSLNPRGPAWDHPRGSVRSACTVSTLLTHSSASNPPAL